MATIWKGAISFGLVTIPVHLESAVRAGDSISFRQLHKDDLSPIRYERFCKAEDAPVAWGDIVKGYEYAPDKFVVIEKEDLKAASPPKSKLIEILDFVAAEEIDPRYFETPYFLLPDAHGDKPYALLREAIRERNMVGIGKLTMREKQHLVGIRAVGDALVLELMRFANELVELESFTFPPAETLRPQELTMAQPLVENLAEPFDPEKYRDEYNERLQAIIDAKLKGKRIMAEEEEEPEGTRVVDLMSRLQESLAMGKSVRTARRGAAASERPAEKVVAKRPAARGAGARGAATPTRERANGKTAARKKARKSA